MISLAMFFLADSPRFGLCSGLDVLIDDWRDIVENP